MTDLALINSNRMRPPIAPLALEYLAGALSARGLDVDIVDPGLADDLDTVVRAYFAENEPRLVGVSFRNVDDCFWPSGTSFVPELQRQVTLLRELTDAPIVLGGVGYSIFPKRLVEETGADYGIRGDGEAALAELTGALANGDNVARIRGVVYRDKGGVVHDSPATHLEQLDFPRRRDLLDNAEYFRRGGQLGFETKRGCDRNCIYCFEPSVKGRQVRGRDPEQIADELTYLADQGWDVLHTCDSEFNLPIDHARAVCQSLIQRGLGERLRWYAYLAVTPFDEELADLMRRSGCVGINFTADSACPAILANYRQPHRRDDLARAVRLCREHGIAVMLDLLIGGPGETPETVAESIAFWKEIGPDCAGASLGLRLYPQTPIVELLRRSGPLEKNPSVRRHYEGPIDLLQPTFYVAAELGENPARLVRDLIGDDGRFFPPAEEVTATEGGASGDHNYSDNTALTDAIAAGARGAYWDILRQRDD